MQDEKVDWKVPPRRRRTRRGRGRENDNGKGSEEDLGAHPNWRVSSGFKCN